MKTNRTKLLLPRLTVLALLAPAPGDSYCKGDSMERLNSLESLHHCRLLLSAPLSSLIVLFFVFFLGSAPALAIPYNVSIDTSSLLGASAQLAFDFIDGGSPTNSVTISSFSTDGTLGSASSSGGVSGSLSGTLVLSDTLFTNEYLSDITLGNFLSFVFEATGNPPDSGSSPDGFAFSLLDGAGFPITTTADPSGINALLGLDIDGVTTRPTPYSGSNPAVPVTVSSVNPVNPVPEPPGVVLVLSGLLLLLRRGKTALAPSPSLGQPCASACPSHFLVRR